MCKGRTTFVASSIQNWYGVPAGLMIMSPNVPLIDMLFASDGKDLRTPRSISHVPCSFCNVRETYPGVALLFFSLALRRVRAIPPTVYYYYYHCSNYTTTPTTTIIAAAATTNHHRSKHHDDCRHWRPLRR
jgi:hypothetical protein